MKCIRRNTENSVASKYLVGLESFVLIISPLTLSIATVVFKIPLALIKKSPCI